jgi:GNAT superfamily N-acetyltransferase
MTSGSALPSVRVAGPDDVEAVVATLTTAFFDDPLWGPAFPDVERRAEEASAMWRYFVSSALRYPWTLVTENVESVAVWMPPGGVELTPEEEHGFEGFITEVVGADAARDIINIFVALEEARPSEPHFYLSLLATHDDYRGKGLGMALLRESLARIDAQGAASYLESSNPANIARYESVGFVPNGKIAIGGGRDVTTMWRSARKV